MSAPAAEFLETAALLQFAPVSTTSESEPYDFREFEQEAADVALRLFPRILPAWGEQIELLVVDFRKVLNDSGVVRKAIPLCEPKWRAYFAGRTIETYAHGVAIHGRGGTWSIETLESTARMLSIAKRPVGVTIPEAEVALAATTLMRLALQTKQVEDRARAGGRPTAGPVLFDLLESPFPSLTKVARADIAAGLLGNLAQIEITGENILKAKKSAAARARKNRVARDG